LLSDGGEMLRFNLDSGGRVRAPEMQSLPAGPGTGWSKEDRDSESMVRDPRTGQLWVGFENWNAIWRYAPGFARAERHVEPREMA
ncbi:esterase-like activity of phytase family protein, partial [Acinetobacter baumannii]